MYRLSHVFAPLRGRPQLAVMIVMIALVMSGNGLVAPMLSIYAATFSASSTMIGMIVALFGLGRLLANMPAGFLSQRVGRRPLLCLGPAVIVVGSIGAALADSFTPLLVWRFVQGIGSGIYMTTAAASLADLARSDERGRVMALYQAGLMLGIGIGPAIGGLLAHHIGFTAPFWAFALVCTVALVVAWFSIDETADSPNAGEMPAAFRPGAAVLFANPLFIALCIVDFALFFTRTASQWQLIPLLGHDVYSMSVDLLGLALTASAVANFVMLPLAGGLIDSYGARIVILWSSALMGLALVVIGVGPGAGYLWAGLILLGVGSGLSSPSVAACAAEVMPRGLYGPAMGMLRTFGDVGFVLGPISVGMLDDFGSIGYAGGILLNSLIILLATAAFGFGMMRRNVGVQPPAE